MNRLALRDARSLQLQRTAALSLDLAEVIDGLSQRINNTAKEKDIPFQRSAVSRATGTDTDAFAYSNAGVAAALISLPLKYMHTTVETVHKDDVDNVIKMIYETVLKIQDKQDFRYLS